MADLELKQRALPRRVVAIDVVGSLDAHTFNAMERALTALQRAKSNRIIVRLDKVDYISSAGAGVFIGAFSELRDQGGDLILVNPTTVVRAVFETLGLMDVLSFAKTEEEALRRFK